MAQVAEAPERRPTPERQPLRSQSSKRIALRVIADGMAVSSALFLASIWRFEIAGEAPSARADYTIITLIAVPVWLLLFWVYGLYEPRQVLSPVNEFKQVFHGVVAGTVVLFVADSLFRLDLARLWAISVFFLGLIVVGGERLIVRKMLHFLRRRGGDATRTIVLGANHEARTVARTLEREGWLGYRIVGFVDDETPVGEEVENGHVVLGQTSELKELIAAHNATLLLVAATAIDPARLNRLFWELQDIDIDLQITSGTIDLLASRMTVQSVAGVPLLYVRRTGMDKAQATLKRTLDLFGSFFGLLLLSPFLAGIALWIKRDSEGGAFFTQVRSGQDGELFKCWKFRTMVARRRGEARRARASLGGTRPPLQAQGGPTRDEGRQGSAPLLVGRAAAALERAARRDEPRRTPARITGRGRAVRRLGAQPPEGQAGDDRSLAGQRPDGDQLLGLHPLRPLLHPELVALPRPMDPVANAPRGHQRRRRALTPTSIS